MATTPLSTSIVPFTKRVRGVVTIPPALMEALAEYALQVGEPLDEYIAEILWAHVRWVRQGGLAKEAK